ncbi:MAG: hypothetical protein H5U00_10125, partial [Clostridia bacterium]|nr:hypothetical protein [Clostridia bacterium]
MLFGILLVLLCVGPVGTRTNSAWATRDNATPRVELTAEVGWQGKGAVGGTVPAVVRLKNPGPADLTGVVEVVNYNKVVPPAPPGTPPGQAAGVSPLFFPTASFGEQVSLPAGSEKQVTLWFPLTSPERMLFRFRSGEAVLGSTVVSLQLPGTTGPLPQAVGVLGQVPPVLERLRLVMPDGVPRAPLILPLTARLLPETGDELDACRTLLVTDFDGNSLTAKQRQALAGWLRQGGRLIVGGGAHATQALAVLPEGERPVAVTGTRPQADWRAAARWLGVTLEDAPATLVAVLRGEDVLPFGPEAAPLGLEAAVGNGRLLMLAFDPLREPWRSGTLGQAFWKKVLGSETPDPDKVSFVAPPPAARLGTLVPLTQSLPENAFPPWPAVTVYLLVFTALAGPLTFFLLRRYHRPELAWVVVPLLALGFAGAAYGYMRWSGGRVIINGVQVAAITPEGEVDGYTALGFFAPTARVFEAKLADPGGPVRVFCPEAPADDEPHYSLVRGRDLTVRFGRSSQWQVRALAFRQDFGRAAAGLEAALKVEGTALTGTVRNGTKLPLDHVTLMLGDQYYVVPELAPGREVPVRLEIPAPPTTFNPQGIPYPPYPASWRIFLQSGGSSVTPAPGSVGSSVLVRRTAVAPRMVSKVVTVSVGVPQPALPADYQPPRRLTPDEQRRAMFLEGWPGYQVHGAFGPSTQQGPGLTLVAWSTTPLAPVVVPGTPGRQYYLTMLVQQPRLSLPPGKFTLPAGLVQPVVAESQLRQTTGYHNLMGILDGHL